MTPREAADNVEAAHEERCDDSPCSCVYRMRAALSGEPDPMGEAYRWPILTHSCREALKHGCDERIDLAIGTMEKRIAESMYRPSVFRQWTGS